MYRSLWCLQTTVNSELLHLLGSNVPTHHLCTPSNLHPLFYPHTLTTCNTQSYPISGVSTFMQYYVHKGRTTWDLHSRDFLSFKSGDTQNDSIMTQSRLIGFEGRGSWVSIGLQEFLQPFCHTKMSSPGLPKEISEYCIYSTSIKKICLNTLFLLIIPAHAFYFVSLQHLSLACISPSHFTCEEYYCPQIFSVLFLSANFQAPL